MVEIVKNVHPIILDTVVVSLFVLIIFFGVIKGIKKTLIDFLLFAVSLFLGFSSYTDSVKMVFAVDLLNIVEMLPAGSDPSLKVGAALFQNLIASIALFLLFYILLHVIKVLITMIRNNNKKDEPKPKKSKAGRVFGGVFSLIYQGAILIFILIGLNGNLIGMNSSIQKSTITKAVTKESSSMIAKIDKDEETIIMLKLLKGDVLYKVGDDLIDSYEYIENKASILFNEEYIEILKDETLTDEEVYLLVEERIVDLGHIAYVVKEIDNFNVCKKEFNKFAEDFIAALNRAVVSKDIGKIEMDINELGRIRESLQDIELNDNILALFDEIVIGK